MKLFLRRKGRYWFSRVLVVIRLRHGIINFSNREENIIQVIGLLGKDHIRWTLQQVIRIVTSVVYIVNNGDTDSFYFCSFYTVISLFLDNSVLIAMSRNCFLSTLCTYYKYKCYQIRAYEMGGELVQETRNSYKILVWNLKGKYHYGDLGIDERLLEMVVTEIGLYVRMSTGFVWLRIASGGRLL